MNDKNQTVFDLVIPGLFGKLSEWSRDFVPHEPLPALQRLLSQANHQPLEFLSLEALLQSLVYSMPQQHLPAAELRGGLAWSSLCADPVFFQASMRDLHLHRVMLSEQEQLEFGELIDDYVKPAGYRFKLLDDQRGLLTRDGEFKLSTTPLSVAVGQGVHQFLPEGADAAKLQTLATEIQMLLFEAPLNQQRELRGESPVNGLWFWGEGQLAADSPCRYQKISGHHFLQSIAVHSKLENQPTPECFEQSLVTAGVATLVELPQLQATDEQDDYQRWQAVMQEYEQVWFKPLLSWINQRPDVLVRLYDQQNCFHLQSGKWYQKWRQPPSISSWAKI